MRRKASASGTANAHFDVTRTPRFTSRVGPAAPSKEEEDDEDERALTSSLRGAGTRVWGENKLSFGPRSLYNVVIHRARPPLQTQKSPPSHLL